MTGSVGALEPSGPHILLPHYKDFKTEETDVRAQNVLGLTKWPSEKEHSSFICKNMLIQYLLTMGKTETNSKINDCPMMLLC